MSTRNLHEHARRVLRALTLFAAFVLPHTLTSAAEIHDCRPGESLEMSQAIDWGAAHWNEFEHVLERAAGVDIKNCLEDRSKRNGKVVCERDMGGFCTRRQGPAWAWASPFNKRCHFCPDFLRGVRGLEGEQNKSNRKACYFAVLTHEWAHTCERTHRSINTLTSAAFDFWASKHDDVTIQDEQCDDALTTSTSSSSARSKRSAK